MFIKVKGTSLTRCDYGLVTEGVYTNLDRNIYNNNYCRDEKSDHKVAYTII